MEKIKPNVKKFLYVLGICAIIAASSMLTLKVIDHKNGNLDISKVNNDIISISASLATTVDLPKVEADTFKCKKEKIPSAAIPTAGWRALCTNGYGIPFVGVFWKRVDFNTVTFQNDVIKALIKNEEWVDKTKYGSSTTCTLTELSEATEVTKVGCTSTLTKKITLYTNFVYVGEPLTVNSTSIERIYVIAGKDKKSVDSRTEYLEKHTKTTQKDNDTWLNLFSLSLEKAYADDGEGGGSGDGDGDGEGGVGEGVYGGDCFSCACSGSCSPSPVVCYGGSAVVTRDACSFNANSPYTSPEGSVITYYPFAPAGYSGNWTYVCSGDGLWHETSFSCTAPTPTANIQFQ